MIELYYRDMPLVPAAKEVYGECAAGMHIVPLRWSKSIISHFTALTDELIQFACSAWEAQSAHLSQFKMITTSRLCPPMSFESSLEREK